MSFKKIKSVHYKKVRVYVISVVLGAVAAAAALFLFSLLVFLIKLPITQSGFFSALAFGIGCIVSGFAAGASKRKDGLAAGIKSALIFAGIIMLAGIFINGFARFATAEIEAAAQAVKSGALNKIVIAVLCGAAGGIIGVNKNGGF